MSDEIKEKQKPEEKPETKENPESEEKPETKESHDAEEKRANKEKREVYAFCTPRGISLAAGDVRLELLPEISALADEIRRDAKTQPAVIHCRQPSPPAAKPKQTPPKTVSLPKNPHGARKSARKRRRGKKIAAAVVLTVFAGLLGFAAWHAAAMMNIFGSVNYVDSHPDFEKTELLVSQSAMQQMQLHVSHTDETKNILLIGCDVDEYGISRSDSMIILSLDHTHRKIKMTSLMRDMRLQIPDKGQHKLNAAFTYGGGDLLLTAIYANFGIKIDKYVCVDYAAFAAAVDYIGGVDVEIEEMELEQFNKYVRGKNNKLTQAGTYAFNGQQALSYCRIRKVGSDTARTARQRKVLTRIMDKCRGMSLVSAENMLRIIAPSLTTNLTRAEIIQLIAEGLDCKEYDTLGARIPVDGTWDDIIINKTWYVKVDLNRNARYLNEFIYGSDDIALSIASRVSESDSRNEARDKASYEKKKAKAAP